VWSPNKDTRRALETLREQLGGYLARLERLESAPTERGRVTNLESLTFELDKQVSEITQKNKDLTFAIAEGIERTDRAERRIRNAIQRARKELGKLGYEDPGLEAEASELRILDGDGSGDGRVPVVPEEVEAVGGEASSIKGVSGGGVNVITPLTSGIRAATGRLLGPPTQIARRPAIWRF